MADSFKIDRESAADGTVVLLKLTGELDINARDDLRDTFRSALDDGAADIVVDLGGVTFLDSEALGGLIDGYNAAQARTVGFRVVNARGLVDRVLSISGALDLFGA
ncbi:MAG: STAS domain-containing protein [Actinoplanes sp.]